MDITYIIAGFSVGLIVGMTGIGGGSLMTPLLILVFDIKPAIAVGTDLLYAAVTKCGGIWAHQRRGHIRWRIVMLLTVGSVPGALTAIYLLKTFPVSLLDYDRVLTKALSLALIATALVLLSKRRLGQFVHSRNYSALQGVPRDILTACSGFFLGGLITLSSVGAGVLVTALLMVCYPHMRMIQIIGTDLAHAVPITAIAGLGHAHLGTVDIILLINLLIGSLPGVFLGGHIGHHLPENIMRYGLITIMLGVGLKMAFY